MIRKAAGVIISISWQMIVCALVITFLYYAGNYGYEFGKEIFSSSAVSQDSGKDMIVIVEKNASDMEVAKLLEGKGLIHDWKVFYVQAKLYQATLYPGTYTLNTAMSSEDMLEIMNMEPIEPENAS